MAAKASAPTGSEVEVSTEAPPSFADVGSAVPAWTGTPLFDAHCHLQLPRLLAHAPTVVEAAKHAGVTRAACCGCAASDWAIVERLAAEHPAFVAPQFGVHPWWAGEHEDPAADVSSGRSSTPWLDALGALLRRHPSAGVGECGLDGARKRDIPMCQQLAVLEPQLELARELQRPVSLHCVNAHGTLLEALKRVFGQTGHDPGLVLHSYCGSADMVLPFSRLNCYFSFSASVLHVPKHAGALRAVPLERLLLETDSPDQLPRELCVECGATPSSRTGALTHPRRDREGLVNEPAFLPTILSGAAAALHVDTDVLAATTAANAWRIFGKGPLDSTADSL